ncbi:hypothetical protein [Treponema saccharophilum]|uniref:hypothetical protein n=1 Tax=Treponema saccharophilum TaxID=165 RepID=UPI003868FE54
MSASMTSCFFVPPESLSSVLASIRSRGAVVGAFCVGLGSATVIFSSPCPEKAVGGFCCSVSVVNGIRFFSLAGTRCAQFRFPPRIPERLSASTPLFLLSRVLSFGWSVSLRSGFPARLSSSVPVADVPQSLIALSGVLSLCGWGALSVSVRFPPSSCGKMARVSAAVSRRFGDGSPVFVAASSARALSE